MIVKKNIPNVFIIFLAFHLVVWTVVPAISNINLPLDTIEALAWGSDLDWGYNKHPPLSAFFVELVYFIFGAQDWAYYLLSQIFVIIAFIYVWKFSEEIFNDKIYSLLSVLILESIYFYNFTTPEFNVNICQLPFSAIVIYYFWKSINTNRYIHWLIFGVFSSLGFLSKYLFIYLLASIFIYFLLNCIKTKKYIFKYFISIIFSLMIISPHLKWLVENDFITIFYGFNRTGLLNESFTEITNNLISNETNFMGKIDISFKDHIYNPVIFIFKQLSVLIPFIFIFSTLVKKLKIKINFKDKKTLFLISINLIPFLLVLITALITGAKIRTMWMTPFYLFLGILVIYIFKRYINLANLKKFYFVFLFFLVLSPITYLAISLHDDTKRTDFPGKEIARLVQNKWENNFRNEIRIVIGDEWYAGNLSYHLSSRPTWLQSLKGNYVNVKANEGVIYAGNPQILKKICPGVFGEIRPVGYCMIGQK